MAYAQKTEVGVSRTQAEIKDMLQRAGAGKYMTMEDADTSAIAFEMKGRRIRFTLPGVDRRSDAVRFSPERRIQRTAKQQDDIYEQMMRARWRALLLCIKAKLEAVEIGITTFEEEFLAHIIIGDGKTIGQRVIPELSTISNTGPLLLT